MENIPPDSFIPYYPISAVTTGLYTKGGEFTPHSAVGINYIGLYHKLPNGNYYSEEAPTPGKSFRLIHRRFDQSADVIRFNKINQIISGAYRNPVPFIPKPTERDRGLGYMYRYFVQKRNDPHRTITEIDADQYATMNNSYQVGINSLIWSECDIKWSIKGDYAEQMNRNAVNKAKIKFPGIEKYFKNYLEFWR